MAVTRLPLEVIEALVTRDMELGPPRTQEDCCAIGARISVLADDGPWTDDHVIDVAADMAAGLFGKAFDTSNACQKAIWIDMCEAALRKAII